MAETEFYNNGEVVVSNSRFIVDATTYAMSGITSVTRGQMIPSKAPALISFIIGLILLLLVTGTWAKIIGIILIVIAYFIYKSLKTEYIVILKSSSGESKALSSTDLDYINEVIEAVNDALVHRG